MPPLRGCQATYCVSPDDETQPEVACSPGTYANPDRRHPALGYRSPHQWEADLLHPLPWLRVGSGVGDNQRA